MCAFAPITDRPTDSRKIRIVPAALLMIAAALLSAVACAPPGDSAADQAPVERAVRVADVFASDPAQRLRLPGETRAVERARPAFLHAGHLAERRVRRGESVRAGQVMAILHNPALAPAVAAAEARMRELDAQLVQLDREMTRVSELHARGLASEDELDRARARRDATREGRGQAAARLGEAREQLAEGGLRAPFDGVVVDLLAEPGDFLAAGQPVLELAGRGALEVELHLPERLAGRIEPGHPVEVRRMHDGAPAPGRVREAGRAATARPQPVVIEFDAENGWRTGQSVQVELAWRDEPVLTVPVGAIIDPGTGRTRVFQVLDGRARRVEVRVGRLMDGRVEISGALDPSAPVVVAGHASLLDGEAVRILP